MIAIAVAMGVIAGLMLAELRVSRAHEQTLRAAGAIEPPDDPYVLMAVLYPAAFLVMGAEGLWRAAAAEPAASGMAEMDAGAIPGPAWAVSGLLLFVASKALKYWAIGALGGRWSFRVLVEPGRPLVRSGPYRYVSHPNYIAVVGELVGTAMMVGARLSGPIMTVLFGLVLWARVRVETRALSAALPSVTPPGKE